jgi:hypothetical protein
VLVVESLREQVWDASCFSARITIEGRSSGLVRSGPFRLKPIVSASRRSVATCDVRVRTAHCNLIVKIWEILWLDGRKRAAREIITDMSHSGVYERGNLKHDYSST